MTGRRDVIKAGLATLAATQALPAWSAEKSKEKKDKDKPRPPPSAPLMTKAVPSTGERLAAIGVGTNNYSPTTMEERAARREVLAGLTAAGASVIDTAPSYRQSEQVIGELLADIGNRKQAFIATKVT
ncbi:MAG TPA: aldo/keto reductase, partial [Steroidobacteraceae bacterium]|nr:aldo/keto reductase [Steroidobacteraceae bacterium]